MEPKHQPVLLNEALASLQIVMDGNYVDATFGRGGHSQGMLERLGEAGRLLVMDRDPEAIAHAESSFASDARVHLAHASFSRLEEQCAALGWQANVHGILMDLGVSSPQLDEARRGFSFQQDGPLDMRMDPESGESAAEWLQKAGERDISLVLRRLGEEKFHRRIARAIVNFREEQGRGPRTTGELAELVGRASPMRERHKHPATRTFQALRIFINQELEELESCLAQCLQALAPGGRLCVISFHSLEDRIVKRFMRKHSQPDPMYAGLPDIPPEARPVLKLIGKPIRASREEQAANPRSRSAIMRVAERLP